MNNYLKVILVFFVCWFSSGVAFGQETLAEKKARADEFFKNKNWVQAEQLYASIISDDPKNHDLNFRYGACLLNGSKNKEEAIKRLRFAVTGAGIDNRAYYYLGRAYHLNYQFNEAIKQYAKFQQMATPQDLKELDVEADLKACNFGKKLLATITDMIVLEKTELKSDKFYDLYNLDDIGGNIIITDMFQTKLDQKRNHRPIIHFPNNSPFIYYSSYGEDGSTGLDIYVKQKLPGGEWSLAQKVKGQVNTELDEDFAYMHPNGEYLYFCSKGHNSMGGYDVFRSRFDQGSNSFGPPENLDFAISSPDDDVLFIVDSLDRTAYFASTRESGQGNITVYKVRVDRIPMQMAVIKGNFLNTIESNEREITIEVEDFSSGRVIGTFNSKQTNGDYLVTFPKSGKYNYYITPKGSDIAHKYTVDVPYSKDFKPLKQSMNMVLDANGEESIVVTDLFGEDFDDPIGVMAEVYRELSKLAPNSKDFNIDSLDALKESDDVFVEAGLDAFITAEGVVAIVEGELDDLVAEREIEQKQANIAYNLAAQKSEEANALMVDLNLRLKEAEQLQNPTEKSKALQQILKDKKEIEELNSESLRLIELGKSIDQSIKQQDAKIAETQGVLNQVKVVASGDRSALIAVVEQNSGYFKENVKTKTPLQNPVTEALKNGTAEQKRVQDLSADISALSNEKRALEAENKRIDAQIAVESKKKVIEELERKKASNETEIEVLEKSISSGNQSLDKALNDNQNVRNGIAAATILKDENQQFQTTLSETEKTEIANQVKANDLTSSLAVVDAVLEENKVSSFNIDLYASNEVTKNYSLQDWDTEIEKEQERLRLEKLSASKERQTQLQAEIDKLEKLRTEKTTTNQVAKEDPSTISPTLNQYELIEDLDRRIESIDAIVNESDRRKAGIELNNEMLVALEKEKEKLQSILIDNPKAKNVKQRLNEVIDLQTNLVNQNTSDKEWILANESKTEIDRDQVIIDLDPNYQQKVNKAYEIADQQERATAITGINEVMLEKANERMQELQAVIDADPSNAKAKKELEYLNGFVKELSATKDEPLVEPVKVDVASLSPTVVPTDLINGYTDRLKAVQAQTDETNRKEAENKLYAELIQKSRDELVELDQLLIDNPGNKVILKRQEALRAIDRDYNKLIVKNDEWLAKNKPAVNTAIDETTVVDVNPSYQTEIDRINALGNSSDREKAIENLNTLTLDKIDERLEVLDGELEQNPNNEDVIAEQKSLENLKATIENNKSQALLTPTSVAEISVNPEMNEIYPTFEEKLASINASTGTENEKIEEKIALNLDLLSAIDAEIKRTEALKIQESAQADRLNERIDHLSELKADTEKENADLQAKLEPEVVSTNRTPVNIETLMPSYATDLAAISNGDKTEQERLKAENELHQMLVGTLDWQIKQLEEERVANPSSADVITKEIDDLEVIKAEKETLIKSNETNLATLPETNTTVARSAISVGALMSDYDVKLTDIRNGSGTDAEKWQKQNTVHGQLIDKVDAEIAVRETEKSKNPDLSAVIDQEINQLKDIKRKAQSSININEDLISQTGANTLNRPEITLNSLVPDFETKMAEIDRSKSKQIEKLNQKNNLNAELVRAVDKKIIQVQEEWEEDPNNGFTYNEEINKLEELKESVKSEMARNREEIADLENGQVDVATLSPADFNTKEGKAALATKERELAEIKAINGDISLLEDQFNATEDDNEKAKLQKSIDKLETTKAGLENEVIEAVGEANKTEFKNEKGKLEVDQKIAQNSNTGVAIGIADEITQANDYVAMADQKMAEAANLRAEAAKEKDTQLKNDKLTQAFELEEEAKNLVVQAQRIYKIAESGNALATENEVISTVPENVANRRSTQVLDEAADLQNEANTYYNRAKFLRDSSETVKEKYRAPILNEADALDLKGDQLSNRATELEEKGEALKAQEDQVMAVQIASVEKTVNANTAEQVAATEAYKNYSEAKNEGDNKTAEINTIQTEIEELKQVRTRKIKQAIVGTSTNPQADLEDDAELKANQEKIDSLTAIQNKLRDEALASYAKARDILNEQSTDQQENMMALEQEDVKPYVKKDVPNVDFTAPTVLENDIFRTTTTSVYSDEARIPVSEQQPSGLVYKVQVGAFRNPLPQDHFKEFAPISGEKLNNGITRYMVGYFTTFAPANEAKGKVNALGYSDAFIVAYCNGERITIDRARLIEQGVIECNGTTNGTNELTVTTNTNNENATTNNSNVTNNTSNSNNTTANSNNSANNNTTNTNANSDNSNNTSNNTANTQTTYTDQSASLTLTPTTTEERQLVDYYTSVPNAAKANQVEIIKGLFYTVQIGVYSKPVPNSALFNIQPLNSQRTPTGFIRYSTGIFTSVEDATARKNEIVQIGITDAFVTAYFNGERITVEEALEILKRDGASALVGRQPEKEDPTLTNTEEPIQEKFYAEGLYYRILLGKYEDAIPGEYATLLLRGDNLIDTEVGPDGETIVFSSKLESYEDMIDRLREFADLGIEDMQIVTYYKYDVIPFDEGEKIRNGEEILKLNPIDDLEGISANSYIYTKEAVYFKIKLGEFDDKVPTEFTNLLLLYEDEEGINKEETLNDEIVFYTGSINGYAEAEARKKELIEKGFNRAIIIAYHKYDEISIEKAREILEE